MRMQYWVDVVERPYLGFTSVIQYTTCVLSITFCINHTAIPSKRNWAELIGKLKEGKGRDSTYFRTV